MTYIPLATYRLQLSPNLKLKEVKELIPYLHNLGISTIYAAPFFTAAPGSEHGYDVVNPHQINPEIGTLEELEEIAEELRKYKMGWLQDIVPNHMAYHPTNVWLMDVLEKGQKSNFYTFFDIDFAHPEFEGKVMVPFLGEPLEKVLEQGQLKLTFDETGFHIAYFDNVYPASINSYPYLLQKLADDSGNQTIKEKLQHLEQTIASDKLDIARWQQAKQDLHSSINDDATFKKLLASINSNQKALQELLDLQFFKLCFWQESQQKMNYRRFFTVNDLICLSIEKPEVFEKYHQFIKQLCQQGLVQGLRVDHVDGLFDPDKYLQQLREMAGDNMYLVVEKILEGEELMPDYWPIQGNSGYDFLAWVSNVLTDPSGEEKLTEVYQRTVPTATTDYEKLVFDKKLFILEKRMQGELQNLLRLLQHLQIVPQDYEEIWYHALAVWLASFPIYRVYGNSFPLPQVAHEVIEKAYATAMEKAPERQEQLEALRKVYQPDLSEPEDLLKDKLYFVMRSQQFTGPLAAKGVEDTAFYNYNRLISLNEVGNSPEIFNLRPEQFHKHMQGRQQQFPYSINATATHDTKRGEDARLRINVISELPEEWEQQVQQWIDVAVDLAPGMVPRRNDLYFIFQALLGVVPMDEKIDDSLIERVQEYITKALRETKARTNWTNPNEEYEEATKELAQKLLKSDSFLKLFLPFFRKLSHYGWLYSLNQLLLKLTCPGVPDIYQGCELWDLSLVDPDNRRKVDYSLRQNYLEELQKLDNNETAQLHRQLLHEPESGCVKLYLLYKILAVRNAFRSVAENGDYMPLQTTGKYKNHILAFARVLNQQWLVVVIPRLLVQLVPEKEIPLGNKVWDDTAVILPGGAPVQWKDELGNREVTANGELSIAILTETFPVALLTGSKV
ncbi:malto-oligosyltrehalose synthase [Pontibacter sp. KCTC 32443]|uniref:malto-oligosyltrehalose synthase n=1 Tax=Pontibacter TaxID=323449 RepID=UPI00164ECCAB|nr:MULTISPECIES: malto-oligosyltrehalose synthase [Pontibacter]MBC5772653.1 malto-oligosyltrehalose synthase [Pontibacter sp. KCTC 32443]